MIYSVTHMILSYKSPRHCFSYVVITRYFHITCKCIFYLKVGRENYHHKCSTYQTQKYLSTKVDLFREFRGYHKS